MSESNGFTLNADAQVQMKRIEEMVANAFTLRRDLLQSLLDPRRNLNHECGYPEGNILDAKAYQDLYDREPVANRVVKLFPQECWQTQPLVYEEEDSETVTEFEEAWDAIGASLRGEQSHYREEEGSPVWEYLQRLDELSRIGHYGVLLFGLDDGMDLAQPAKGVEEKNSAPVKQEEGEDGKPTGKAVFPKGEPKGVYNLTVNLDDVPKLDAEGKPDAKGGKGNTLKYLRVFPETLAQITQWEANPTSPRYGHPVMYKLDFYDPSQALTGFGMPQASKQVHWTRVLHAADNLSSSEFIGVPAIRPVLNPILDVQKVRGASGEGYYRTGFPGIAWETHPQLGGQVNVDLAKSREQMEQWMNGLQKTLIGIGGSYKMLPPSVTDPTPWIEAYISTISIQLGCPVRVFKGSERGELASSQDERAWRDRVRFRQANYITPRLIIPFIDRLIMLGCLPAPAKVRKQEKPLGPGAEQVSTGEPSEVEKVEGDTADKSVMEAEGEPQPFPPKKPVANRGVWKKLRRAVRNAAPPFPPKPGMQKPGGPPAPGAAPRPSVVPPGKPAPFGAKPPMPGEEEQEEVEVLETPGGYCIEWPDVESQSKAEKAKVAVDMATAVTTYAQGGGNALIPELDFLVRFLGFTEEEAQSMIDAAALVQEEALAEQQLMADEYGFEPTPPEGFVDPEQREIEQDIAKTATKTGAPAAGGKPPFGGKGGKPPFPPKGKPAVNAEDEGGSGFASDEQRRAFFGLMGADRSAGAKSQPEQAKPPASSAPQPSSAAASSEQSASRINDAYERLASLERESPNRLVRTPRLYHELNRSGLVDSPEDFRDLLGHLWDKQAVQLHILNEVRELPKADQDLVLRRNDTVYAFAYVPPTDAGAKAFQAAAAEWVKGRAGKPSSPKGGKPKPF